MAATPRFSPAETASARAFRVAVAIAGLVLAGVVTAMLPRTPLSSWNGLWLAAFGYPVAVVSAAVAPSLLAAWIRRMTDTSAILRTGVSTAIAGAWLAPSAVLLAAKSGWAMLTIIGFAVCFARLIWSFRPPPSADGLSSSSVRGPFAQPEPTVFEQHLAAAICAAVFLQLGGMLWGVGSQAHLAFFGVTAAIVTWRATATRLWPEPRMETARRSLIRTTLFLELAMVLTAVGLASRLLLPGVYGTGSQETAATQSGSPVTSDNAPAGRYAGNSAEVADTHPGVILWPEVEKHAVLVPPLPAMKSSLFDSAHAEPMSIPFFGVYWMFNPPHSRPPKNSIEVRGSPEIKGFHSSDSRPLKMEAHQNLGKRIDLRCCSRVDVEVKNTDFYGRTVTVELTILDSTLEGPPSVKLGAAGISSRPRYSSTTGKAEPTMEVLSFPIPDHASMEKFDEFLIEFHRAADSSHSSKIGIHRFILVPRTFAR